MQSVTPKGTVQHTEVAIRLLRHTEGILGAMYEQLIASPAINQDVINYTEGGAVRKEILSRTFTMRDFVHAAVRCWLDLWLLFAAAMSVLFDRPCWCCMTFSNYERQM